MVYILKYPTGTVSTYLISVNKYTFLSTITIKSSCNNN